MELVPAEKPQEGLAETQAAIVEMSKVDAGLAALGELYKGKTYDVTTKDGLKAATAARKEIRDVRYKVQNLEKDAKAALEKRKKSIGSESERICAALLALETPIDKQIKAQEEAEAAAAAEKKRIEDERVARLKARIDRLKALHTSCVSMKDPDAIEKLIVDIEATSTDASEFAEFSTEATALKAAVLETLREILTLRRVQAQQAEQKRLDDEAAAALAAKDADKWESRELGASEAHVAVAPASHEADLQRAIRPAVVTGTGEPVMGDNETIPDDDGIPWTTPPKKTATPVEDVAMSIVRSVAANRSISQLDAAKLLASCDFGSVIDRIQRSVFIGG